MTTTTNIQDADEARTIDAIVDTMVGNLTQAYPPGQGPMQRDAHPKMHGCVEAEFIVGNDVPAQLRIGVFARPRTFRTWIRFSNGAPKRNATGKPKADDSFDVRGFAAKLLGVEGEKILDDEKDATTQDFVLANSPSFFVKSTADYLLFVQSLPKFIFPSWNPLTWRWFEAKNLAVALLKFIPSPTEIRYWSQLPYKLGDNMVVKYSVKPRSVPFVKRLPKTPNRLRATLVRQLQKGDVLLDFMIQVQTSDREMPIEDPRVRWSERKSPFIKVATIRIPKQDFNTPERDAFGEQLSFTPWHSLPEHEPLGGIGRTRRAVYRAISKLRHAFNGVPRQEPT